MNKKSILTLTILAVLSILTTGCTNNPEPSFKGSFTTISGEINPHTKIPRCKKGVQKNWLTRKETISLEVIEGLVVSHSKGHGVRQDVCKTQSGRFRFFIYSSEIDETSLVK